MNVDIEPVDAAAVAVRAAGFAERAFTGGARTAAVDLAIRCIDLTTLEGSDTPRRVRALCAQAARPGAGAPSVAAVCVYPTLVAAAKAALDSAPVTVASVASAFPSGLATLPVKLADVDAALAAGADEIDMVIDRGAFLAGDERRVADEIRAVRARAGEAVLKVILETGELGGCAAVYRASRLALDAGADFIKTSTGKIAVSATLESALVMAFALRDFARETGERRGLKVSGGVRSTAAALAYLALVDDVLGTAWFDPARFRIGASGLLDDLVRARTAA